MRDNGKTPLFKSSGVKQHSLQPEKSMSLKTWYLIVHFLFFHEPWCHQTSN